VGLFTIVRVTHRPHKEECPYVWSKECEPCFQMLKRKLVIALVFTLPLESVRYVVYTNASQ
jgi:hypothetical protein